MCGAGCLFLRKSKKKSARTRKSSAAPFPMPRSISLYIESAAGSDTDLLKPMQAGIPIFEVDSGGDSDFQEGIDKSSAVFVVHIRKFPVVSGMQVLNIIVFISLDG